MNVVSWIVNVLLWVSIIFMVIAFQTESQGLKVFSCILFVILLITYWAVEFCSSTCQMLCNPKECGEIYGYMKKIFYSPANLVMTVQCWHQETKRTKEVDAQGKKHNREETIRVDTNLVSTAFNYMSWRDVSGTFSLDTSGAMVQEEKAYVKLHLSLNLEFANDGTRPDYEMQREYFKSNNRNDEYQDYWEKVQMPGFNEFNLVRVSDYQPTCFGLFWYILFTLITLVEFYKLYISKYYDEQNFTITKMVSTRRDLNSVEIVPEYQQLTPCIAYMGQNRYYEEPFIMPQGAPKPQTVIPVPMQNVNQQNPGIVQVNYGASS